MGKYVIAGNWKMNKTPAEAKELLSLIHIFVNGVPFALLRAISDDASGKAQTDYPAFADRAARKSAALLLTAWEGETRCV